MEITTSGMNVIAHGTIVSLNNDTTEFKFSDDFTIVFKFLGDSGKLRVEGKVEDNKLALYFYNYYNQLGTGNSEPLALGTLNGLKVYLNYGISIIGNTEAHTRLISYTFLTKVGE